MEWSAQEWAAAAAIAAVIVTVATSAAASAASAFTYWREQDQREWSRLQDLIKILYNSDFAHGGWAQIAAISEMTTLARRKEVVRKIAAAAADHWQISAPTSPLISELRKIAAGKK